MRHLTLLLLRFSSVASVLFLCFLRPAVFSSGFQSVKSSSFHHIRWQQRNA
jgi:hypothetical protein